MAELGYFDVVNLPGGRTLRARSTLGELKDVSISNLSDGQTLLYRDGYGWINHAIDDLDTDYILWCSTPAATANKVATSKTSFTPISGSYYLVFIKETNTASTPKMRCNDIPSSYTTIYINGSAASSTNKDLPAGLYLAKYDGTRWCFNTSGMPGDFSWDNASNYAFKSVSTTTSTGDSAVTSATATIEADSNVDTLTIAEGNKWIDIAGDATNDKVTIGHSGPDGGAMITAGSNVGNNSSTGLDFGSSFNVPYLSYDKAGHITGTGTKTLSLPANPNTDTTIYCDSPASTKAKTATCANFDETKPGWYKIFLKYGNTANSSTTNVSISVNGGTAFLIKRNGLNITTSNVNTAISAGLHDVYFDGTYWRFTEPFFGGASRALSCSDSAASVSKYAGSSCPFTPIAGNYPFYMAETNTASSPRMNINGTSYESGYVYVNGTVFSSTNPINAGWHYPYFDGTDKWWFRNDGKLTAGGYAIPNGEDYHFLTGDGNYQALYFDGTVTNSNPILTESSLAGIIGAMVYKGTVNSNSDLPSSGVQAGWTYVVATAGTYAGQACEVGDMIIAKDSTPTWNIVNGENQVTDGNSTLSWGAQSTVATVDGTDIHVTMPAKPLDELVKQTKLTEGATTEYPVLSSSISVSNIETGTAYESTYTTSLVTRSDGSLILKQPAPDSTSDTPSIFFRRGSASNAYTDWAICSIGVESGTDNPLQILRRYGAASSTWTPKLSISNTAITTDVTNGITSPMFVKSGRSADTNVLRADGGETTLATVATSGSYNSLTDTPTIDTAFSETSTNAVQNNTISLELRKLWEDYETASKFGGASAQYPVHNDYISSTNNQWTSSSTYRHWVFPLDNIRKVVITANSNNQSRIAFLKTYTPGDSETTTSGNFSEVTGFTSLIVFAIDTTRTFYVPNDAKYLYVYAGSTNSFTHKPASIKMTGIGITEHRGSGSGFIKDDGSVDTISYATTASLATVATSGSYADLSSKPVLNTNNSSALPISDSETITETISLHKVAKTGTYSDLRETPVFRTINGESLTANTTNNIGLYDGYVFPNAVQDYDGNWYSAVVIGDQVWLGENLRTTHLADGTAITDGGSSGTDMHYRNYTSHQLPLIKRGLLYSYPVAAAADGAIIANFKSPSSSDYSALTTYLDNQSRYASVIKSMAASDNWASSDTADAVGNNLSLNNGSGFRMYPTGICQNTNTYSNENYSVLWVTGSSNTKQCVYTTPNTTTYGTVGYNYSSFLIALRLVSTLTPQQFRAWYVAQYGTMQHHLTKITSSSDSFDVDKNMTITSSGTATVSINPGTKTITIGGPSDVSAFNNDSGYITSAALSDYLPLSGGTLTGQLTINSNLAVTGSTSLSSASISGILTVPTSTSSAFDSTKGINFATSSATYAHLGSGTSGSFGIYSTGNIYLRPDQNLELTSSNTNGLVIDETTLTYNTNTVWHAGNDGSGSGLDADTLDGHHASYFAQSSHTHGNIQSDGTLQTNDVTIASGDKLVITDANDSNKIARSSLSFNTTSTDNQFLSETGSWLVPVDEKVKQVKSTSNVFGRLMITSKNTPSASGTIDNDYISYSYYSDSIMANPSTGEVVVGDLRATGNDVYVGSASGSQCHQQYDATNKCLKFIFD